MSKIGITKEMLPSYLKRAKRELPMRDYSSSFMAVQLDLESVIFKLCQPLGEQKWSLEKARKVEQEYRRWLYLHRADPSAQLVPSKDIDEMWHVHILDTRAYAADCESMFGHFLHHFPYSGMGSEDAKVEHRSHVAQTAILYKKIFGEQLAGLDVECTNCDSSPAVAECTNCDSGPARHRPRIADLHAQN